MNYVLAQFKPGGVSTALQRLEAELAERTTPTPPDGFLTDLTELPSTGNPVPTRFLVELRGRFRNIIAHLDSQPLQTKKWNSLFDVQAGKILQDWFARHCPDQAARLEVWPYLCIVVLPEYVVRRFPADDRGSLQVQRYASGRRNALYRPYLREVVFDGADLEDLGLNESELVGIMERNLSVNHELVHAIARQLQLESKRGEPVRTVARELMKKVQFEQKTTDLTGMSDDELSILMARLAEETRRR